MSQMEPYIENRDIELSVTRRDTGTVEPIVENVLVEIPRDTSVAEYWVRPAALTEQIVIRARFRGKIDSERTLIATRYWSPTEHYISISTTTTKPTVGNYIIFSVQTNVFIEHVYYYIVSAGNIVVSDFVSMYSRSKLFSVAVSRDMCPSARIVAFYISPDGQVAADSLQFHADGTKIHKMTVKFNRGKDLNYDSIEITATADPLSYVAFSALEYQMYHLGIRNGLSWEEVNQELYTYDKHANTSIAHYWRKDMQTVDTFRAVTPSYAGDANSTFYYSGLYIFTDANVSAVYTMCNLSKGEYPCMDGKSCYNYQQICDGAAACVRDHRDEMGCHLNETTDAELFDDDGWDRTKHVGAFYRDGAFMWKDQFTKPDGRIDIKVKPPPYGVSWVVSGFAMSRENGLGIAPGLNLFESGRPMYIHVQGPSSIRLGEIVALRVTVFNRWTEQMDILLSVAGSDDYKFIEVNRESTNLTDRDAEVNGEHQVLLPVNARGNRQIYMPIAAKRTGIIAIPIRAMCVVAGHSVTHHLSVGYDGIEDRNITNYQVDLRVANSETLPDLWLPVEETSNIFEQRLKHHIPGSPASYVNVIGDIVGVSFFPYTNYDLKTKNLLGQSYGSGPEAIFNYAMNVNVLSMLRSLGTISSPRISQSTAKINLAMQEMYAYMNPDGAFREFDFSKKRSTWVSATALQVMATAIKIKDLRNEFYLPQETLNLTANWLLLQQDNRTGRFTENDVVHNRRFQSHIDLEEVNGVAEPANLALTALCVTSLSKASTATALSNNVIRGIKLGAGYLADHYQNITDPFEMAIVTYALFVTGTTQVTQKALTKLKSIKKEVQKMTYWSTEDIPAIEQTTYQDTTLRIMPKGTFNTGAYTVATTAYALLTYMENSEPVSMLEPIQRFLQEQHLYIGGFSSSQDTLVAMQALKALAEKNQDRATYKMTFNFTSDQDPNWMKVIVLDQTNWFDLQRFKTPSHWGSIHTEVKGRGIALVQLETTQNFDNKEQIAPPPTPGIFDLGTYNLDITTKGFNHSFINYKICPKWNGVPKQSGMAVLEIAIPSGYRCSVWALQKYVKDNMDQTSIRGVEYTVSHTIFYFEYLNKSRLNCIKFTAYRWFPVANMAELTAIKVYEYYEPGNYYSAYYEKFELLKLSVCLVCGSYQCPYCPNYNAGIRVTPSTSLVSILTILLIRKWSRLTP